MANDMMIAALQKQRDAKVAPSAAAPAAPSGPVTLESIDKKIDELAESVKSYWDALKKINPALAGDEKEPQATPRGY